MSFEPPQILRTIFDETTAAHQRFSSYGLEGIATAADAIGRALLAGRKLLAFGNGGSASDAEHLVAELVGRFEGERRALAGRRPHRRLERGDRDRQRLRIPARVYAPDRGSWRRW